MKHILKRKQKELCSENHIKKIKTQRPVSKTRAKGNNNSNKTITISKKNSVFALYF